MNENELHAVHVFGEDVKFLPMSRLGCPAWMTRKSNRRECHLVHGVRGKRRKPRRVKEV